MDYFLIYKPFQVLSQFTSTEGKLCLKDILHVPNDVYPVGRLDYDSEGLLLITNDKTINQQFLNPVFAHQRTYWVQVDGAITEAAIVQLSKGVSINVDGKIYKTKPAQLEILPDTLEVPERNPPIRFRKSIPTSWVAIQITEGKNRQVRKMTAAVGFPTLRLIRTRIGGLALPEWHPGAVFELTEQDFFKAFDRI